MLKQLNCILCQELQKKLQAARPLLESLGDHGPQLAALSPGEGASKIDEIINKDNKKFDNISDQVEKRAEKVRLKRHKSMEVSD